MMEITAEIRALIDKAAAGVELAGDEYIDPADGLIHCKKCGGQRQTVVPCFSVTACEPLRRWSFAMENGNMSGSWEGIFETAEDGTRLHCTETFNAKRWWMRPFVPGYLRHQQRLYLDDLRRELQK